MTSHDLMIVAMILAVLPLSGAQRGTVPARQGVAHAEGPSCKPAEANTRFGQWAEPAILVKPNRSSAGDEVQTVDAGAGVAGMQLNFRVLVPGNGGWKIAVRDADQHLVSLLDASDFADGKGGYRGVWTGRIARSLVTVELLARSPDVRVELVQYVTVPSKVDGDVSLFSIRGAKPAWESLFKANDARMAATGATVGMLHTADVPAAAAAVGNVVPQSYCCTGVMVSDDLFLTNHHCGGLNAGADWTQDRCDRTLVDLGWEDGGVRRQLVCSKVEAQDRDLDYALLRLTPVRGSEGARGGAIAARRATTPSALGDAVFVIHHAQCSPKLVSRRCALRDRRPAWTGADPGAISEWGHDCDTEPGASGAPVFNRRGELIALHHLGFKQCGAGGDRLNSAVSIDPIALDIRRRARAAAAEIGW